MIRLVAALLAVALPAMAQQGGQRPQPNPTALPPSAWDMPASAFVDRFNTVAARERLALRAVETKCEAGPGARTCQLRLGRNLAGLTSQAPGQSSLRDATVIMAGPEPGSTAEATAVEMLQAVVLLMLVFEPGHDQQTREVVARSLMEGMSARPPSQRNARLGRTSMQLNPIQGMGILLTASRAP